MPKNGHNAVPVNRLLYVMTPVKHVIYKYIVQENLGPFIEAAKLQCLMSAIITYLSLFKRQNHYFCVSEGILLLQDSNSLSLNFSAFEQHLCRLFFTSRGRLKQGNQKYVQIFTREAEPFCNVTDRFPLAAESHLERSRSSVNIYWGNKLRINKSGKKETVSAELALEQWLQGAKLREKQQCLHHRTLTRNLFCHKIWLGICLQQEDSYKSTGREMSDYSLLQWK